MHHFWKITSSTRPKQVYTIPSTDSHRYFNIANTSDIGPFSKKTMKVVNDCKGTRLRPSQMLQEHYCTSKSAFWSTKKKHEEELPSDKVRTSKQDRPQQIIMPQWERRRPNLEGNWNQTWQGVSRLRMKSSWLYQNLHWLTPLSPTPHPPLPPSHQSLDNTSDGNDVKRYTSLSIRPS